MTIFFGAIRYTANSLGIQLTDDLSNDRMDQPLTAIEIKQNWQIATFRCQCDTDRIKLKQYGSRSFCQECSLLIFRTSPSPSQCCPVCQKNESWRHFNAPCLSCQIASIIYRNPFQSRYQTLMHRWLSQDDSDADSITLQHPPFSHPINANNIARIDDQDMLSQRNRTLVKSFQTIKARSSAAESRIVFQNLSMLQQDIQNRCMPKNSLSSAAQSMNSRIPLSQIDTNTIVSERSDPNKSTISNRKRRRAAHIQKLRN